jgi:hypothetical protein
MRFALFASVFAGFVMGGCGGSVSATPTKGMACAFDEQCGGGRCSASGAGCGVCLTPRKLGEVCTGPLDACARSATCTDDVCVSTKKVVGQTCALGPGGLLPVDQKECDDELYCEASEVTSTSGICRAAHGIGDVCSSLFVQCRSDLQCVDDTCVPGPGSLGEPCGPYPRCADDTLECNARTMRCQTGTLALGEPCGIVEGNIIDRKCAPPNVCWTADGMTQTVCVALPNEGEPCAGHECAAPLFCRMKNDNNDRCERPRNEGEACVRSNYGAIPCTAGLECRESVCRRSCR